MASAERRIPTVSFSPIQMCISADVLPSSTIPQVSATIISNRIPSCTWLDCPEFNCSKKTWNPQVPCLNESYHVMTQNVNFIGMLDRVKALSE